MYGAAMAIYCTDNADNLITPEQVFQVSSSLLLIDAMRTFVRLYERLLQTEDFAELDDIVYDLVNSSRDIAVWLVGVERGRDILVAYARQIHRQVMHAVAQKIIEHALLLYAGNMQRRLDEFAD